MRKQSLLLAVCLALVAALPAAAQRLTGTIRGTVSDPTQAIVAGAKVTLKEPGAGLTRTTETNSAGAYVFTELPIGTYDVTVEHAGFKSAVTKNVVVSVAETREVDLQLATGELTETVSVEAAAVQVRTVGGDVSGLVTGEQLRELPLNGRNFAQLTLLMPGVTFSDGNPANLKDKGLAGGVDISVSGSSVTSNMWMVDGANNNDVGSNRTILIYPSAEAIEEFKIHRNAYGAEFGQAGGAQINVVTRRGSNEFKGSVYYFGRNDALNSKNYFLRQTDGEKDKQSRHEFGYTIGGPIVKDRLHFFASQEWNREQRGVVRTGHVPTLQERVGDFSGALSPCSPGRPIDPLTGAAFPGNRIPESRISPGGRLALALFPEPNVSSPVGCNNWVQSVDAPQNWRQENARLDYSPTDRTRLMLRYTQDTWINGPPSSIGWGDDPYPSIAQTWEQPGRSLTAQLNQTIGTTAVNTLQFSYSANRITTVMTDDSLRRTQELNAAIPTVFSSSLKFHGDEMGHVIFDGLGDYQNTSGWFALGSNAPFRNAQDLFVLKDDYSQVFGRHLFKAGFLVSYNKKDEGAGGWGETPNIHGAYGLNAVPERVTNNPLADLLLRDMTFNFNENSTERVPLQRWRDLELYVNDSWQLRRNVTLDLGLRWSYLPSPYMSDDKVANFDPASFNPALGGDTCNGLLVVPGTNPCAEAGHRGGKEGPNRGLVENAKNLFAPRLGIAWDVRGNGKTALRAGLGQFFARERLGAAYIIGTNPPFSSSQSGRRKLDTSAEPCTDCFQSTVGGGVPIAGRELKALVPNNWQWNIMLQQELFRNTTIELGYIGNKGVHLHGRYDVNQVPAGDNNGNGVADRLEYAQIKLGRRQGNAASLRPFGVFGDSNIVYHMHGAKSSYHGFQSQLVSRFGRGSQVQVSYTLSDFKATDPLDDSGPNNFAGNLTDANNPDLDWGRTPLGRKHLFNASLILALPALEGQSSMVKNVFGDWQITGSTVAMSGSPMSVYTNAPDFSGTGYAGNQRPNRVAGEPCRASSDNELQWLNPNAFTLNGLRLGEFGDAERGVCDGPGFFTVDMALYKNIRVTDRFRLQLRFEVFNVFNRDNFFGVNANWAGEAYSLNPAGTEVVSSVASPSFGQILNVRDSRQAQFGLKLSF